MADPESYGALAESAWAWVQEQVRRDDAGLWLPEKPAEREPGEFAYGLHSGIAGLAHVLSEIRLARDLTPDELALSDEIAATLVRRVPDETEYDYFNGLVSTIGALVALDAPGADLAVTRLRELATPDGWQPSWLDTSRFPAEARCNDVTLGTASVLLGALWALRYDVPGAADLAAGTVDVLLAEQEPQDTGVYWPFLPLRFVEHDVQMPNWSHGQAGIAGSLAAAGVALDRPDLVEVARLGSEHLLSIGETSDGGLRFDHRIPGQEGLDRFTYTWCHGPAGTSLLFAALDLAGVPAVGGRTPYDWERACLHSLSTSGIPERRYPGFWDNDGRCCGTAGVGDVVLNVWQRHGRDDDLAFAVTLADAIVDRAVRDGDHTYWRFVEHRNDDPLLPPGAGWMQGAAGIAAYLFRLGRVLERGRTALSVARMDTWWAVPRSRSVS